MSTQTTDSPENLILELRRSFPVSRERLYNAWTDPDEIKLWFGPSQAREIKAHMDVRPGGKYSIDIHHDDGEVWTTAGEFREVTPPSRLVYTWRWLDDEDWENIDSVITVEFNEQPGGGAELHLTHRGFPTSESRGKHEFGWTACIDKLETVVNK